MSTAAGSELRFTQVGTGGLSASWLRFDVRSRLILHFPLCNFASVQRLQVSTRQTISIFLYSMKCEFFYPHIAGLSARSALYIRCISAYPIRSPFQKTYDVFSRPFPAPAKPYLSSVNFHSAKKPSCGTRRGEVAVAKRPRWMWSLIRAGFCSHETFYQVFRAPPPNYFCRPVAGQWRPPGQQPAPWRHCTV